MDRYEELANKIIDEIEDWIQANYPKLKAKNFTDDDKDVDWDSLAIINGTPYYNLETHIAGKIRGLFSLYGVCKWWIETYPKDVFVGKTEEIKEIVDVREIMKKILAKGVAKVI